MDIRYHLASLVGVFLALGVGMLIGTQLAHSGTLEGEQLRLAERLEASLEGLRAENRSLKEAVAALESQLLVEREFADAVLAALAAGTLAGTGVDVYVPPDRPAAAERLERLLEAAGAAVRRHEARGAGIGAATPATMDGSPWSLRIGEASGAEGLDVLPPATVVLWADGWEAGPLTAWPAGTVVAVPGTGAPLRPGRGAGTARTSGVASGDESGSDEQGRDRVEAADTPWGLFALLERLRTGEAPPDAQEALRRRIRP